jgi:hypothetical protein
MNYAHIAAAVLALAASTSFAGDPAADAQAAMNSAQKAAQEAARRMQDMTKQMPQKPAGQASGPTKPVAGKGDAAGTTLPPDAQAAANRLLQTGNTLSDTVSKPGASAGTVLKTVDKVAPPVQAPASRPARTDSRDTRQRPGTTRDRLG